MSSQTSAQGGINPAEIEAIIGASPVIARHDAKWGERPILRVELREGQELSDEELVALLQDRVPSWWMPDAVVRLTKMPLAGTGKIDKRRLRAEFG